MEECRYFETGTLGSDSVPGLNLNPHGPWFMDPDAGLDQQEQQDLLDAIL